MLESLQSPGGVEFSLGESHLLTFGFKNEKCVQSGYWLDIPSFHPLPLSPRDKDFFPLYSGLFFPTPPLHPGSLGSSAPGAQRTRLPGLPCCESQPGLPGEVMLPCTSLPSVPPQGPGALFPPFRVLPVSQARSLWDIQCQGSECYIPVASQARRVLDSFMGGGGGERRQAGREKFSRG